MLTPDQIREACEYMDETELKAMAARCGMRYRTLQRLLSGEVESRPATIQRISDYLEVK